MTVKITPYEAENGYEDHYVSQGKMAFSLLSEDDVMIGPLVDCKGYISNRIHGFLLDHPGASQYKYQPVKMAPISMEKTRILVNRKPSIPPDQTSNEAAFKVAEKELAEELELAMDLLHPLEKDLGLVRSKFTKTIGTKKEYGPVFLVEGSKRWMLAPPMISLYLLLLRNGSIHKLGRPYIETLEKEILVAEKFEWAKVIAPTVEFIVKNKYWKVFGKDIKKNYPDLVNEDTMNNIGIACFGKGTYAKYWPHWMFNPATISSLSA